MNYRTLCILAVGLGLSACNAAPAQAPENAAPPAEATAPVAGDAAAPEVTPEPLGAGTAVTSTMGGKVSANNATEDELKAAFEAAGIDNAEKWADEVAEYRPYPADDPNWTKLRDELSKYNPDPATVDKIIGVLEP